MALESAPLVWWPLLGVVGGSLLVCLYAFVISISCYKSNKVLVKDLIEEDELDETLVPEERINPLMAPSGKELYEQLQQAKAKSLEDPAEEEVVEEVSKIEKNRPPKLSILKVTSEDKKSAVPLTSEESETSKSKGAKAPALSSNEDGNGPVLVQVISSNAAVVADGSQDGDNKPTAKKSSANSLSLQPAGTMTSLPEHLKNIQKPIGSEVTTSDVVYLSDPKKHHLDANSFRPGDPYPRMYRLPPIPGVLPQGSPRPPEAPSGIGSGYFSNPSGAAFSGMFNQYPMQQNMTGNWDREKEATTVSEPTGPHYSGCTRMDGGNTVYKPLPKRADL